MQAEALDTFQDTLRESLAKDGLSSALAMLKKALPEQTEKYNLVFHFYRLHKQECFFPLHPK